MGKGFVGVIIAGVGAVFVVFGVIITQDWISELQLLSILALLNAVPSLTSTLVLILEIMVFIQPELLVQWNMLIYIGIGVAIFGSIVAAASD